MRLAGMLLCVRHRLTVAEVNTMGRPESFALAHPTTHCLALDPYYSHAGGTEAEAVLNTLATV